MKNWNMIRLLNIRQTGHQTSDAERVLEMSCVYLHDMRSLAGDCTGGQNRKLGPERIRPRQQAIGGDEIPL